MMMKIADECELTCDDDDVVAPTPGGSISSSDSSLAMGASPTADRNSQEDELSRTTSPPLPLPLPPPLASLPEPRQFADDCRRPPEGGDGDAAVVAAGDDDEAKRGPQLLGISSEN